MSVEKKTRSREILDAALRLFAERGFDGVSVRDICSALSVNSSIISYYFGGKRELYLEVLRDQFTAYGRALEKAAAGEALDPREALAALMEAVWEAHAALPCFAALLARENGRPSPEFARARGEYESAFGDKLAEAIGRGQRQGLFRPHLKAAALTAAVRLLLSGPAAALHQAGPGDFSQSDYFETVQTLLSGGLWADPAEEGGRTIGKQSARARNAFPRL